MKALFLFSYFLASTSLIIAPSAFAQGPLTPPGAPAPTMKTLDQIASTGIAVDSIHTPGNGANQFIISSPGSYYLTTNITGVSGKNGILISSANVTLDLNGFAMFGVSGSLSGITDGGANSGNATIRNGTVRLWGQAGITLAASFDMLVERLISTDNAGVGIALGDSAVARDCMSRNNGGDCFTAGFNANLFHCTAVGSSGGKGFNIIQDGNLQSCVANFCSQSGFLIGPGCVLAACQANQNGSGINAGASVTLTSCNALGNGGTGIQVGAASSLASCIANSNMTFGIYCDTNCILLNCNASANTGGLNSVGIYANDNSTLNGCMASGNQTQYGIFVNPGSTVAHCNASHNFSTQTTSVGIAAVAASVIGCTAVGNTGTANTNTCGMGIYCNGSDTHIENCTLWANKGDGIRVTARCTVVGNHCTASAAGVHATGGDNHIEGNNVDANSAGILVDGTVNLVFRNTARGNTTNYSIVAGNRVGTIVVPAVNTAITGNSGGTTFTNDSFSNIAF